MTTEGAFEGLTVLDLAGPEADYCGRLFADLGADVIKIEPPGGSEARRRPPFAGEPPVSLYFDYYNRNKRGVVVDVDSDDGAERLRWLVSRGDVLIESYDPGYLTGRGLGYDALSRIHPGLVMISITPFGQTGPRAGWKGGDFIATAASGVTSVSGLADGPPVHPPMQQAADVAGAYGALAAAIVLFDRGDAGRGDHIDVSMQTALTNQVAISRYSGDGHNSSREGSQHGAAAPGRIYPAKDGFVHVYVSGSVAQWRNLVEWIGNTDVLGDQLWEDMGFRRQNVDIIDQVVRAFTTLHDVGWLVSEGQRRHIPVAPVNRLTDLTEDDQLEAREYFVAVDDGALGPRRVARSPLILSGTPCVTPTSAPRLGEHDDEILAAYEKIEAASTEDYSTGFSPEAAAHPARPALSRESDRQRLFAPRRLPFERVRVLEFATVVAGPVTCQILADYGAEVIKIESRAYPDYGGVRNQPEGPDGDIVWQRWVRTRSEWCRNKLDVSIDARTDRGRELILRLAAGADVVVNNFSVGVMDRLGLGYEALSERHPELIYVDLQGFGQTGPRRDWVTYGPSQMAFAGFTHLWNQPDQPEPVGSQLSHPDFVAAAHAALAILAALHARRRTGRGQHIDIAQFEISLAMLGPLVSEALITGVERKPLGNRSEAWAPQGCYPCRGDDRWIAIEIRTDDEWRRLGEAIGGEWVDEERFADNAGRLTHAGDLDELISAWTRDRDAEELAELLQKDGVRAVLVFDSRDLHDDPHLMERGYLQEIDHPDLPRPVRYGADPLVFRRRPQPLVVRAPRLGEDNDFVLGSILDLAPDEIERLIAEKVVW